MNHFNFWLFNWTNLLMKYRTLHADQFRVHSVDDSYDLGALWRFGGDGERAGARNADGVKVGHQLRQTRAALQVLQGRYHANSVSREVYRRAARGWEISAG